MTELDRFQKLADEFDRIWSPGYGLHANVIKASRGWHAFCSSFDESFLGGEYFESEEKALEDLNDRLELALQGKTNG